MTRHAMFMYDAFPTRHTYASYSDAFMTRSVSDAWETRLISSVECISRGPHELASHQKVSPPDPQTDL